MISFCKVQSIFTVWAGCAITADWQHVQWGQSVAAHYAGPKALPSQPSASYNRDFLCIVFNGLFSVLLVSDLIVWHSQATKRRAQALPGSQDKKAVNMLWLKDALVQWDYPVLRAEPHCCCLSV